MTTPEDQSPETDPLMASRKVRQASAELKTSSRELLARMQREEDVGDLHAHRVRGDLGGARARPYFADLVRILLQESLLDL